MESELDLAQARQRRGIELGAQRRRRASSSARCKLTLVSVLDPQRGVPHPRGCEGGSRPRRRRRGHVRSKPASTSSPSVVRSLEAIWHLVTGDAAAAETAVESARRFSARSGDLWTAASVEWVDGMLLDAAGDAAAPIATWSGACGCTTSWGWATSSSPRPGRWLSSLAVAGSPSSPRNGARSSSAAPAARPAGTTTAASSPRSTTSWGSTRARSGDHERARTAHLEARAWYSQIGVTPGSAFTESCLGFLAGERGDRAAAAAHHANALDDAEALGDSAALALAFEGAVASFADGDALWAAEVLGAAGALREARVSTPRAIGTMSMPSSAGPASSSAMRAFGAATRRGAGWRRARGARRRASRPSSVTIHLR